MDEYEQARRQGVELEKAGTLNQKENAVIVGRLVMGGHELQKNKR